MTSNFEHLRIEIARASALTKTGELLWEIVPGYTCRYQTCNTKYPLVVSCCNRSCFIETKDGKQNVPCAELAQLCEEIVHQINAEIIRIAAITESVRETLDGGLQQTN
jgi:hypothetical protein